jgi:organic radical activating enzyme
MDITSITKTDWITDYTIQWRPLMMCNYDCSYCSPESHTLIVKSKIPTAEDLVDAAKKLRSQIPSNKSAMIVITGGEPFLIKDIHIWLNYLLANGFWVMVFTNGSLSEETYKNCQTAFSNPKLLFRLSFHPETSNIDRFAQLATSVQALGASVEIRAMLVNTLFDKVDELEQKAKGIKLIKLPVFPLYNKKTKQVNPVNKSSRYLKGYNQKPDDGTLGYYSQDELETLNNYEKRDTDPFFGVTINNDVPYAADKIQLLGKNKFTGWNCAVGSRKLIILPNGDIHYGFCNNEGIIGNLFTDDITLFDKEYTVCKKPMCGVIEEIMIDKSAPIKIIDLE